MFTENRPNRPTMAAIKTTFLQKTKTLPCIKLNNPVRSKNNMAKILRPNLSCQIKIVMHEGNIDADVIVKTVKGSKPNPSIFLEIAS